MSVTRRELVAAWATHSLSDKGKQTERANRGRYPLKGLGLDKVDFRAGQHVDA